MNSTAVKPTKLQIIVKVVNVVCPCGGNCEEEEGERDISFLDKVVWCRICGERYEVPIEAFPKFEQVLAAEIAKDAEQEADEEAWVYEANDGSHGTAKWT